MHAEYGDQLRALGISAPAQRYTGPGAARIAQLIPHEVRFERGWFRTATAICHGGDEPDGLAFRQRPDGNGIEVRCDSGDCPRGYIITAIEGLIGHRIWMAYEPPATAPALRRWTWRRLALWGGLALTLALPFALGYGVEATLLNGLGYSLGVLITTQVVLGRQRGRSSYS